MCSATYMSMATRLSSSIGMNEVRNARTQARPNAKASLAVAERGVADQDASTCGSILASTRRARHTLGSVAIHRATGRVTNITRTVC